MIATGHLWAFASSRTASLAQGYLPSPTLTRHPLYPHSCRSILCDRLDCRSVFESTVALFGCLHNCFIPGFASSVCYSESACCRCNHFASDFELHLSNLLLKTVFYYYLLFSHTLHTDHNLPSLPFSQSLPPHFLSPRSIPPFSLQNR